MSPKNLLFLTLCFQGLLASAQVRFAEGWVVTNEGDTLKGLISQRESDLNPSTIIYKVSEKGPEREYSVEDFRYFSIPGVESYQRFTLSLSMDPINLGEVEGYSGPAAVRQTVFLKVMQRGRHITLLSYRDPLKIRFFVIHSQSPEPQELVYKFIRVGAQYAEAFSFRESLTFIAERAGVMTDKLKATVGRMVYNESHMLKVASMINGIQEEKVRMKDKASTGVRIGAGLNLARLHYYGNDEYAKNAESAPSSLFWASAGYDLARNPYTGKLVFRGDLTFSLAEFTTTTYDYRFSSKLDITHAFTQRSLSVGAYALYNIHNGQPLKFFISVGTRANFSSYENFYELRRTSAGSEEVIPNKDAEPRKIWVSIPFKLGIVIREKVEIGVMYSPNMVLSHGDFLYKYGINSIQPGAMYHF